jgi:hypothetical protein
MNPKIKSAHILFVMIGTVFWIIVGIFAALGHIVSVIIFSILAIICFVLATVCYYYKPKPKPKCIIADCRIHGVKFRDK